MYFFITSPLFQLKEAMKEQQKLRQKLMEKQVISSDEEEEEEKSGEVEEEKDEPEKSGDDKEQEEFEVSLLLLDLVRYLTLCKRETTILLLNWNHPVDCVSRY